MRCVIALLVVLGLTGLCYAQPTPTVTSVVVENGVDAAPVQYIVVNFSEPVTLLGGSLVVTLNNGGLVYITPFVAQQQATAFAGGATTLVPPPPTNNPPLTLEPGATLRSSASGIDADLTYTYPPLGPAWQCAASTTSGNWSVWWIAVCGLLLALSYRRRPALSHKR